jgi:hypothetical protein
MTQITLTPEQAQILSVGDPPIVLRGPDGKVMGYVARSGSFVTPKEPLFTPEEIAEAEKGLDSDGPWYTTKEVLESLRESERP